MILADTSVWVDHLRARDDTLARLLDNGMILSHPFVVGEVALGNLRQREAVLDLMSNLPQANTASDPEALRFIKRYGLFGRGIGYVDLHLLAAVQLTAGAALWTLDKRLRSVAEQMGWASAP